MKKSSCALLLACLMALSEASARERVAWIWSDRLPARDSFDQLAIVVHHILLRGDAVLERGRSSSPGLSADRSVIPVVHVEISARHPPPGIGGAFAIIKNAMRRAARSSTSGWVQLDLEARPSQRREYLQLVSDIRRELPAGVRLSVTALAWWCSSTDWLDQLDADEIVPMFFRMRSEGPVMRERLLSGSPQLHPRCRAGAAAFSLQEMVPQAVASRYQRSYWFDHRHWR